MRGHTAVTARANTIGTLAKKTNRKNPKQEGLVSTTTQASKWSFIPIGRRRLPHQSS